jgi:hypothetical protein
MQTRRILWTDQVARWTTQWKRAPNSTTIIGCTTAFDVADAPDASADHPPQFQTVATETATITNPGPTLWLTPVFSRQMHFNVFVPAPEQFVAGPTLPAALGRIAIDPDLSGPVVLRTDGPAGWERSPAVWNALSVFVQKVKSPATSQPSDAPRAVDVEVNGSGETSRWYFHPDGTFDHAEMAGGVVVQPGDANQIKSTFAGDPRMNVDN